VSKLRIEYLNDEKYPFRLGHFLEIHRNSAIMPLNYGNFWFVDRSLLHKTLSDCAIHFISQLMENAKRNLPCSFCNTPLVSADDYNEEDKVYVCPTCTWTYESTYRWVDEMWWENVGLLRSFDLSSREEGLTAIACELILNWNRVHELDPSAFERFVAAVIKGCYDCEARWVGRSGDGGIDIIALISDDPVAIQVKRRMKKRAVEGVGVIREFCGAMIENDYQKGIFVTSADHFSVPAKLSAKRLLSKPVLSKIELIDSKTLCELFGLIRTDYNKWKKAFVSGE